MDDYKQRVRKIIEDFNRKQIEPHAPPRQNKHPERTVQAEIYRWCKEQNFSLDIVSAESTWDHKTEGYTKQVVRSGFSDAVGVMENGIALYIEFKAKGKRNMLKEHQKEFLIEKISFNAFACCSDGVEHISSLFTKWKNEIDLKKKREILMNDLPIKKNETKKLFDK